MSAHTHGTGGGWAVTRWVVPGCPACEPDPLRAAAIELLALKDGPRGADYERRKPLAWAALRLALDAVETGQ